MPILEYVCPVCGKNFDELVKKYDEAVLCPDCKTQAVRAWAGRIYSSTGKQIKHCSGNCKTCGGCR